MTLARRSATRAVVSVARAQASVAQGDLLAVPRELGSVQWSQEEPRVELFPGAGADQEPPVAAGSPVVPWQALPELAAGQLPRARRGRHRLRLSFAAAGAVRAA
jgi:hypothetical protein